MGPEIGRRPPTRSCRLALRRLARTSVILFVTLGAASCSDSPTEPSATAPDPRATPGGATTIEDATSFAYKLPAPNLTPEHRERHLEGDVAFDRVFVTAPASRFGGLGPIFNQSSCAGCHVRNGRDPGSLLVRVSRDGTGPHGGPVAVDGFGLQIQDRAVIGTQPEASVQVTEVVVEGSFADGQRYTLSRRLFELVDPYLPLGAVRMSPRMAPAVFGLGLLEGIPEEEILARADPDDADGDGISGRPNWVWDRTAQAMALGRFGWKANEPDLRSQSADAYNADMGITSPLAPVETSAGQIGQDDGLPDDPEIDARTLDATAFYVQTLAVPAPRRANDPRVRRGRDLFTSLGCPSCHVPLQRTGTVPGLAELSHQTIAPYTDLLLHDMGDDLADGRGDFQATGHEWRTAPLWGIGLLSTVNGEMRLLHDGRARTFWEAILWHGGEAEASRERARALPAEDRAALAAFLGSL